MDGTEHVPEEAKSEENDSEDESSGSSVGGSVEEDDGEVGEFDPDAPGAEGDEAPLQLPVAAAL